MRGPNEQAASAAGGAPLASGSFSFTPSWRPTELTVELGEGECAGGCTLTVTNRVGDEATATFTCAQSAAPR